MKYYSILLISLIFISCSKISIEPIKDETKVTDPKTNVIIRTEPSIKVLKETKELILTQTEPWENQMLGYFNVIEVEGKSPQLWYTSWKDDFINDLSSFFCYAVFENGAWKKQLNINNSNILIGDGKYLGVIEQMVFFDKQINKYKMVAVSLNSQAGKAYTYLYTSDDGIIWKDKKLLFPVNYDTQFSAIIDGDNYILYQRIVVNGGMRVVGKSIIDNQGNIVQMPEVVFSDNNDKEFNHIYNNAASRLVNNKIVFFPTYYNVITDQMYISFAYEKNGVIIPMKIDLTPSLFENETIGWAVVAPGIISTGDKNTYWMYYYGSSLPHNRRGREKGGYTKLYRVKIEINDYL